MEIFAGFCEGDVVQVVELTRGRRDTFQGSVKSVDFERRTIGLKSCRKVGSDKISYGVTKFEEANIDKIVKVGRHDQKTENEANIAIGSAAVSASQSEPISTNVSHFKGRSLARQNHRHTENPHLSKLHPIDMASLLRQEQLEAPPELVPLDSQEGHPQRIPDPEQELAMLPGNAYKDRVLSEFLKVRQHCWPDEQSVPPLRDCPQKLYRIADATSPDCRHAIERLTGERRLGVACHGQCLGRSGALSLISFATRSDVYMFDVVAMGEHGARSLLAERGPLMDILEDEKKMKVMHDPRQASDILWHHYGITLANVYDTLSAHVVFLTWACYGGHLPKYTFSVANLAKAYLGIKGSYLFFPKYRLSHLRADTSLWLQRPITPELVTGAMRDVMYLLDLQLMTREAMNGPFMSATRLMMTIVRDADDMDAEIKLHQPQVLPSEVLRILPTWEKRPEVASRLGVIDGDFVHQCVGQTDPNLIFSRDCVHQNKPNVESQ